MDIVPFEELERRVAGGRSPEIDLSVYANKMFECVCGEEHRFGEALALKELPRMHVLLSCPQNGGRTVVKIKSLLRIRMISKFGAPIDA